MLWMIANPFRVHVCPWRFIFLIELAQMESCAPRVLISILIRLCCMECSGFHVNMVVTWSWSLIPTQLHKWRCLFPCAIRVPVWRTWHMLNLKLVTPNLAFAAVRDYTVNAMNKNGSILSSMPLHSVFLLFLLNWFNLIIAIFIKVECAAPVESLSQHLQAACCAACMYFSYLTLFMCVRMDGTYELSRCFSRWAVITCVARFWMRVNLYHNCQWLLLPHAGNSSLLWNSEFNASPLTRTIIIASTSSQSHYNGCGSHLEPKFLLLFGSELSHRIMLSVRSLAITSLW